jgi:Tfp pilus assembly protein PilV
MKMLRINRRGETLVESVVSIFIFAIFMLAVINIVNASIRITNDAIVKSGNLQASVNQIHQGQNFGRCNDTCMYRISVPMLDNLTLAKEVEVFSNSNLNAFRSRENP